jgi:hypothetical protein
MRGRRIAAARVIPSAKSPPTDGTALLTHFIMGCLNCKASFRGSIHRIQEASMAKPIKIRRLSKKETTSYSNPSGN